MNAILWGMGGEGISKELLKTSLKAIALRRLLTRSITSIISGLYEYQDAMKYTVKVVDVWKAIFLEGAFERSRRAVEFTTYGCYEDAEYQR